MLRLEQRFTSFADSASHAAALAANVENREKRDAMRGNTL